MKSVIYPAKEDNKGQDNRQLEDLNGLAYV